MEIHHVFSTTTITVVLHRIPLFDFRMQYFHPCHLELILDITPTLLLPYCFPKIAPFYPQFIVHYYIVNAAHPVQLFTRLYNNVN